MFEEKIPAPFQDGSHFFRAMETLSALEFRALALRFVGRPYKFGAKWDLNDPDPRGPIDCSGLSRYLLHRLGKEIPDGAQAQYDMCELLNPQSLAKPGDLGFFIRPYGPVHHVGVILDDDDMIEARGLQTDNEGHPIFNAVILRQRKIWSSYKEFGGWMRPNA